MAQLAPAAKKVTYACVSLSPSLQSNTDDFSQQSLNTVVVSACRNYVNYSSHPSHLTQSSHRCRYLSHTCKEIDEKESVLRMGLNRGAHRPEDHHSRFDNNWNNTASALLISPLTHTHLLPQHTTPPPASYHHYQHKTT